MQIYFLSTEPETDDAKELEGRLRRKWPALQKIATLDAIRGRAKSNHDGHDQNFIIIPVLQGFTSFDRIIEVTDRLESGFFLIFVSAEIAASHYKRLVRGERADWASLKEAPEEIEEIILGNQPGALHHSAPAPAHKPLVAAFVPSAGGVGNATLALECAVWLKHDKKTRDLRICVVDLEIQTSHICDYLDIEPRLRLDEIVDVPERLDKQLFDLFISRHSSGVDVLAAPRKRANDIQLNMSALDALFEMIAASYDIVILDLPTSWCSWTPSIISASDVIIVTGLNTVPGLRQVADTLASVRSAPSADSQIAVALNRCEAGLLGGVVRSDHIHKVIGSEEVLTVREDTKTAIASANTGIPMAVGQPSSRISKDIRALAELIARSRQPAH
ncbi:CpaE family protein [Bradyrhizobium erythrophlei]|uniref:AAA family ATPase n=1 Tax=Bradyrhizobium erythrophlei TaxID=1437360 RepID=UPI0035EF731A